MPTLKFSGCDLARELASANQIGGRKRSEEARELEIQLIEEEIDAGPESK